MVSIIITEQKRNLSMCMLEKKPAILFSPKLNELEIIFTNRVNYEFDYLPQQDGYWTNTMISWIFSPNRNWCQIRIRDCSIGSDLGEMCSSATIGQCSLCPILLHIR